jgi:hypothetical protein
VDGSDQGVSGQLGSLLDPEDVRGHEVRTVLRDTPGGRVPTFAETVRDMLRGRMASPTSPRVWRGADTSASRSSLRDLALMTCVRSGFAPRANFDAGHSLSQFDVSANAQNAGATFASSFDTDGSGSGSILTPRSHSSAHSHRHRWRDDAASAAGGSGSGSNCTSAKLSQSSAHARAGGGARRRRRDPSGAQAARSDTAAATEVNPLLGALL